MNREPGTRQPQSENRDATLVNSEPLRLALISEDLSLPVDEGLKKFVYSVAGPLGEQATVRIITTNPRGTIPDHVQVAPANKLMLGSRLRALLRDFRPQGVIYVPRAAATRNAFIRARALRSCCPGARQLLVSLQPRSYGFFTRALIRRVHPDVLAAQSFSVRDRLTAIGVPAVAVPSGVDVRSFSPVSASRQAELRRKYHLDPDAEVVLHIGHLKRERNVQIMERLRRDLGCEAMMVASTSTEAEPDVTTSLRAVGVRVVDWYVENVAELYQMAGCYLFPVWTSGGAIEMPLSVLEAMACGTPVVSTPFGSLPEWLPSGPGLSYASDDDDLIRQVSAVLSRARPESPRAISARIAAFSWESVAQSLLDALGLVVSAQAPPRGVAMDATVVS